MMDYPVSSVIRSMAKLIIWIVEDSGKLTKASLKYAVKKQKNKVFVITAVGLRPCTMVHQG